MSTTVSASAKAPVNRFVERWFFTSIALTMLAISVAAFAPSIIETSERRAPLTPLVAVHGLVFFSWLGIFLVQSWLIATNHTTLHRRMGIAACFVAATMLILGYATFISMVRRGFDLSGDLKIEADPFGTLVFAPTDLLIFGVLFTTAVFYRRRTEIHRRLILFANISLMGAPLAHFMGHNPRLTAMPNIVAFPIWMFLLAAVGRDYLLEKRVRPLTLGLALAFFLSGPLRAFIIGPSAWWHRFVVWLAG
jgi:hypothetical protein